MPRIPTPMAWSLTFLVASLLLYSYWDALGQMIHQWLSDDNYSHALLVPFVTGYLLWRHRASARALPITGQLWGFLPFALGCGTYVLGEIGAVYTLLHLSLWLIGIGLCITAQGIRRVQRFWFPLSFLITAIPLPHFLYQHLSAQLQLISSSLGVGCLQLVGITAFRDGNVIDLGPIQLQVVEACSGLRYLFPLFTLALLCGYLYRGQLWKRLFLILSSIPISILLNGFRIGVVGLLVDVYGPSAGEGFLHLFEGWLIFLASVGILWIEVVSLNRIQPIGITRETSGASIHQHRGIVSANTASPRAYVIAVGLVALLALSAGYTMQREEQAPLRRSFVDFPMTVGDWSGRPFPLESHYLDVLRLSDYLLVKYDRPPSDPVDVYVAYYGSQRKGQSAHSPQSCIPGGGWEITALESRDLSTSLHQLRPYPVNRAIISKGDQTQIVYYWFKQRDRVIANEYLVKALMVWDGITRHRTDGALVRLSAAIQPGETESSTDERVTALARQIVPLLDQYVPN